MEINKARGSSTISQADRYQVNNRPILAKGSPRGVSPPGRTASVGKLGQTCDKVPLAQQHLDGYTTSAALRARRECPRMSMLPVPPAKYLAGGGFRETAMPRSFIQAGGGPRARRKTRNWSHVCMEALWNIWIAAVRLYCNSGRWDEAACFLYMVMKPKESRDDVVDQYQPS